MPFSTTDWLASNPVGHSKLLLLSKKTVTRCCSASPSMAASKRFLLGFVSLYLLQITILRRQKASSLPLLLPTVAGCGGGGRMRKWNFIANAMRSSFLSPS